ncbi:MAG: GNAT family N-acetyltransferase [Candidatus Heimdallarchaeota archaeon]|nr:GNAT family N-acetyltransferase [Candidatus Heimdallarchaeota archaeon]
MTNLMEILVSSNYQSRNETIVMEHEPDSMKFSEKNIDYLYKIDYGLDDNWFESLQNINEMNSSRYEGYKQIIDRITLKKLGGTAMKRGEIYGLMLGVIERKHLVIYSMITHPNHRRKGIAKSILNELGIWAKQNDISTIYLQVETDNTAALKLYENAGFKEVYRYRYLEK